MRPPLFLTVLAAACSIPAAPREDVGEARLAQGQYGELLGPQEAGWRVPPSGDFNLDGVQDVLWREHDTNQIAVTLMNGTSILEQGPLIQGPPGDGWMVANGSGDFNADGMSDVLWYDTITNRMAVWLFRGTQPFERGPEIPGPDGDGWTNVPALDFNFDGMADVLWYNPRSNLTSVWLMRGTEPFEKGAEFEGPSGGGWFAVFGADFDKDGLADIFWHNPRKRLMTVWLMNGTTVREQGPILAVPERSSSWILAAAADFNRNRTADELWFDTRTKRIRATLMWSTGILEEGPAIPGMTGAGWEVGDAIDANGDGISDIVWFNPNPLRMCIWLMNGLTPVERGPEIRVPLAVR
jgi:hypothetical protein